MFGGVEGVRVVLGGRGNEAVGGVFDDFFDGGGGGWLGGELFREIAGGKLQGVEQEAGAARVEGGVGDFAHDVADGELDGGAVLGHGEGERFRRRGGWFGGSSRSPGRGGRGTCSGGLRGGCGGTDSVGLRRFRVRLA